MVVLISHLNAVRSYISQMIKHILLSICLCFVTIAISAQTRAVTATGEEVLLYSNGSWEFLEEDGGLSTEIPFSSVTYRKDINSNFLVKSKSFDVGVFINSREWSFTKSEVDEDSEYEFQLKGEDLYAMAITERVGIPLDMMAEVALVNARDVAPNIRMIKEEYRIVNGLKILFLQMSGSISGFEVTYLGYYYSNENGTVQLITYTATTLLEEYRPESEKFLNGLVEL